MTASMLCRVVRYRTLAGWLGLAALTYAGAVAAAEQPRAFTPPDAATIEQQWVAANRPYDEARRAILAQTDHVAWQGPMQPDWQSLTAYRTPDWYRDAKFGIFIHWGVYSVPGFSKKGEYAEWYQHGLNSGDTARIRRSEERR